MQDSSKDLISASYGECEGVEFIRLMFEGQSFYIKIPQWELMIDWWGKNKEELRANFKRDNDARESTKTK